MIQYSTPHVVTGVLGGIASSVAVVPGKVGVEVGVGWGGGERGEGGEQSGGLRRSGHGSLPALSAYQ